MRSVPLSLPDNLWILLSVERKGVGDMVSALHNQEKRKHERGNLHNLRQEIQILCLLVHDEEKQLSDNVCSVPPI
jgi:hypothetical protein